jgi:hypothetical protein
MGFCTETEHQRFLDNCPQIEKYIVDAGSSVPKTPSRILDVRRMREFAKLVVDQTGCGRPACDILRRAGLRFAAVTISAGDTETYVGRDEYRVPKHLLVTALDARLSTKELRFSEKLKEAAAMKAELQDFRRNISATGHLSFNARSGSHDDLILATALAVWWLGHRRRRGEFSQGSVRIY